MATPTTHTPTPSAAAPRGEQLEIKNPATGEKIGAVPVMSATDVDAAVARARTASVQWAALSHDDRAEELGRFRRALAESCDELAELIHRENGKPRLDALVEIFMALSHLDHAIKRAAHAMAPRKVASGLMANY